jgi:hypothetical protein
VPENSSSFLTPSANVALPHFHYPSFRGDAKHRTRNLEIPGSPLRGAPE